MASSNSTVATPNSTVAAHSYSTAPAAGVDRSGRTGLALALVSAGCELVGQRSMTVARPRVGPPALGRAALPGAEPPQSWQSPGRRPSHGDGGRPRASNPTVANTPWQVVPKGIH